MEELRNESYKECVVRNSNINFLSRKAVRGQIFDEDYFEHLIAEIQEIRASERRFYQKITDIYATAVDYDKNSQVTREFYATVQNKMHYAVHGRRRRQRKRQRYTDRKR